jgi:hypothetical protein
VVFHKRGGIDLAKVDVAGPTPVSRSYGKKKTEKVYFPGFLFLIAQADYAIHFVC